ncbi:hypothetical protein G4B88_027858 [Cannabis sativa]|uniref:Pentatricopeptide repeat-containing protein n=1 Tax=Cannabis sativa TaxID=3483 RepID=A0A7J6I6A9_CANSA|nr:hypothetical protein G4B88_027858 [Cannabis sativa]
MYASCGVINEAYEEFIKMPKRKTVSWTTIINGFAKLGRGEEALHVLWTMLSSRMSEESPDEINFIGALCACSHGGLVQDGRHIFKFMIQTLGIKPSIEHYGCMVDLLSRMLLLSIKCLMRSTKWTQQIFFCMLINIEFWYRNFSNQATSTITNPHPKFWSFPKQWDFEIFIYNVITCLSVLETWRNIESSSTIKLSRRSGFAKEGKSSDPIVEEKRREEKRNKSESVGYLSSIVKAEDHKPAKKCLRVHFDTSSLVIA